MQIYIFRIHFARTDVSAWISFAYGDNGSLIVVLFQMNDSLYAPIHTKRTFQYETVIDLSGSDLVAFVVEKLIVNFELRF